MRRKELLVERKIGIGNRLSSDDNEPECVEILTAGEPGGQLAKHCRNGRVYGNVLLLQPMRERDKPRFRDIEQAECSTIKQRYEQLTHRPAIARRGQQRGAIVAGDVKAVGVHHHTMQDAPVALHHSLRPIC